MNSIKTLIHNLCPICSTYTVLNINGVYRHCGGCKVTYMDKPIITLEDYITSSGRYPERANSPELTEEVKSNAIKLLNKVNTALKELGITKVSVSSGFRTSASNSSLSNSAKKSNHLIGCAIDLVDDANQTLCKLFTKDFLIKHDLYREDSDFTKGKVTNWLHLQTTPTKSGSRIFKP